MSTCADSSAHRARTFGRVRSPERTDSMADKKPAHTPPASAEAQKDHGVLYLGIDLGTSRTSVSASNGVRETVSSYVGYPKDVVARKLLQKDVLFGSEAEEKRLSLNFYRPLGHGVIKSDKDSDAN